MGSLRRFYVRETRDELGRYPNWPINQDIGIGQIGFYYGRNADFRWHTTLADLGIQVKILESQRLVDELYTTEDSVRLDFTANGGIAVKADFTFTRKKSIATQGFQMGHKRIDLRDLLTSLRSANERKKLEWDPDWLIITELWSGEAFTTLISGRREGKMSISATTPPVGGAFNIADPSLGLGVSSSSGMAYQGVAERQQSANICPYFRVHKVVFHHDKGLILKQYGDNDGWLW